MGGLAKVGFLVVSFALGRVGGMGGGMGGDENGSGRGRTVPLGERHISLRLNSGG